MQKFTVFALIILTSCAAPTKHAENNGVQLNSKSHLEIAAMAPGASGNKEEIKTSLEDQLFKLRLETSEKAETLKALHDQLSHCEKDLANPLLDGNGKIPANPEVDLAMDATKMKTTLGLDENTSLAHEPKEIISDRLDRETKYSATLKSSIRVLQSHFSKCLVKMQIARMKHGLSPNWYSADPVKGYEQETDLSIGFSNAAKDKPAVLPDFSKSIHLTPPF
jgi:hypothetical protein